MENSVTSIGNVPIKSVLVVLGRPLSNLCLTVVSCGHGERFDIDRHRFEILRYGDFSFLLPDIKLGSMVGSHLFLGVECIFSSISFASDCFPFYPQRYNAWTEYDFGSFGHRIDMVCKMDTTQLVEFAVPTIQAVKVNFLERAKEAAARERENGIGPASEETVECDFCGEKHVWPDCHNLCSLCGGYGHSRESCKGQ